LIWINLANLLPSFRSVRKLSQEEKDDLLDDIQTYWDSYIDNCSGSITTKVHLLKEHVKRLLEFYGTVGLFAEDAMESIHAIINGLARRYCALDKKRRTTQIVRGVEGRKRMSVAKEMMKPALKRSRRQGVVRDVGATTPEIADDNYDVEVANAVLFLEPFETAEAEDTFHGLETKVTHCQKCRDVGTDMLVPDLLLPLHCLIVHSEKGAEI
jgi:hypothetical protein